MEDHELKEAFESIRSEFRSLRSRLDQRFDGIDRRFEGIDLRFDAFEFRFNDLEERMDAGFAILHDQHQEILGHLDGMAHACQRLDTEDAALRSRQDRLEDRVSRLERRST